MAQPSDKSRRALNRMQNLEALIRDVNNKPANSEATGESLPGEFTVTEEGTRQRLAFLKKKTKKELPSLTGKTPLPNTDLLKGNIENYVGMAMVPTGVIGPLRVLGSAARGDFYVPLSTTEGALVASYHRGTKACFQAGGATSVCLTEGVQRSPVFKFNNLGELGTFITWVFQQQDTFEKITGTTSRFARLEDMSANIEGNHLILTFEYYTGDAAGQNMVTICTDEICRFIIEHTPIQPVFWFIEGNYSGDKKATAQSFNTVRGKKVTTEINVPKNVVEETLKTTPQKMAEYWRTSTVGTIQSGAIGAQGHIANGLAALFIATGQDVACVSEASVGITRMEVDTSGGLYASVTLPNLIVGTIGGGTMLPTQKECLEMMDCSGVGKARKFAEICGALLLAGELSIAAALSAGHFSSAHKKFGRQK